MANKNIKNKGFTLMELLTTIVVLGIVSLIAIPQVLNAIESSKRESFKNSASGIIRTVQQHYANDLTFNFEEDDLNYIVENGNVYLKEENGDKTKIPYNGEIQNIIGKIIVKEDESIYAYFDYGEWCAIKRCTSSKIEVYRQDENKCNDDGWLLCDFNE